MTELLAVLLSLIVAVAMNMLFAWGVAYMFAVPFWKCFVGVTLLAMLLHGIKVRFRD